MLNTHFYITHISLLLNTHFNIAHLSTSSTFEFEFDVYILFDVKVYVTEDICLYQNIGVFI